MALFNKETNILITDHLKVLIHVGLIHVRDLNGNLLKSINSVGCLKDPYGICVGIKKYGIIPFFSIGIEEIYVYDGRAKTVFVFNEDFKLIKKIGENLEKSFYLTIDCESDILYCLHRDKDVVTLWNVNDAKLIQKLKIEGPDDLKISENKIYIVSLADYDSDRDKRKLTKVKKGNYINVLNKSNQEIINKIQFDDWFCPFSLHLSSDGDIYTTAFELDKNNGTWSKNRFLFIIDSTSCQIKQKIELKKLEFIFLIY